MVKVRVMMRVRWGVRVRVMVTYLLIFPRLVTD